MPSTIQGLESLLADSWERLRRGQGSLHIFLDAPGRSFPALAGTLTSFPDIAEGNVVSFDPLRQGIQPFSPLADIAARHFAREADQDGLLASLDIYPRHRGLWKALLSGTGSGTSEPPIDEEIHQERIFLRRDMAKLLAWAGAREPVILLCHHAELLPRETLRLLEEEEGRGCASVMVLLCFSARPGGSGPVDEPWADFFNEQLTNGRILLLGDEAPSKPASDDFPIVDEGFRNGPSIIPPDGFGPFLDFLQYETVIRWGLRQWQANNRDPGSLSEAEELCVLEALARAYEGAGDADSGLFYAQLLWSSLMSQETSGDRTGVQCLLARLFKGKNDSETALKTAYLAWKALPKEAPTVQRAEAEFTLFTMNPRNGSYQEAFDGLEGRLLGRLEELGWDNHRALILSQNLAVMDCHERYGSERALERAQKGLNIAEAAANPRRLATAWKTMGSVEQLAGHIFRAEKAFLSSREWLEPVARPFELARNDNGLGYFYFLLGRYDKAFRRHAHALEALSNSRQYEEILGTLFNLGRVYLFNGQAREAVFCMESILRIMARLEVEEIPFHSRRNILSLMGIASLRLGRIAQALEFDRRLRNLEALDEDLYACDYHMWFNCLKAWHCGKPEEAAAAFQRTAARLAGRVADSRHILIRVLADYADFAMSTDDQAKAAECARRLGAACQSRHSHEAERLGVKARIEGRKPAPPKPFPRVDFDPEAILRLVDQDFSLKRLQRKINELSFLQAWQECLRQENNREAIMEKTCALVARHFLAEEAAFFQVSASDQPRAAGRGSVAFLYGKLSRHGERANFLGERLRDWGNRPAYWESPKGKRASYLPVSILGNLRYIFWISGDPHSLAEEDHRILVTAAWQLTAAMELLQLQEKLLEAATVDALTGLANRPEFLRRLDYQIKVASRMGPLPGQEFCILFIDLDNFKRYNDSFGHGAGDQALRLFAALLTEILRSTDQICRYGGDEFMVLLPGTSALGANLTATRILEELRQRGGFLKELGEFLGKPVSLPESWLLSCSIGLAEFDRACDLSSDEIIARADEAAYRAKHEGKNRACEA